MTVLRIFVLTFAVAGVMACGGAEEKASPPATPASADQPSPTPPSAPEPSGAGCDVLRDRVASLNTRAKAIFDGMPGDTAAKYNALGDLMDKLAVDFSVPSARPDVGALSSDYRQGVEASAKGAHELGAFLASVEELKRRVPVVNERLGHAKERFRALCQKSKAADCKQTKAVIENFSQGAVTVELVDTAIANLGTIKAKTKGLKGALSEIVDALGAARDNLRAAAQIEKDGPTIIDGFPRAFAQLAGLDRRADEICPNSKSTSRIER